MHRKITVLILTCAFPTLACADVITFNNGDRLTGKLTSLHNGKLTFASDLAGSVTIGISTIRNLSTAAPVNLNFTDGTVITSTLADAAPGQFRTEPTDLLGAHTFTFADLTAINPPAKPKPKWTGSITLGASSTHGSTFDETANLSLNAKRRSDTDRIGVYATYLANRTRDSDTDEKQTTEENFTVGGKYDYFLTEKLYTYLSGRYKTDHIADLDHRIIAGLGLGYQWLESDNISFSTDAGFAELCEQYTSPNPLTLVKETTRTDEASLQLGYSLDWKIAKKITLSHHLTYYPSFADFADYFLTSDAELRAAINDSMFTSFKLVLDYDSTPADGVATTDTKYILGVGWNF